MAKVNVKFNVQAAVARLEKTFEKVKLNKQMNREIGELVTKDIRFQARRGKPLNKNRKFPDLKGSSIRIREELARFNSTHPSFSPPKSNATFTGQLLDAVTFKIVRGLVSIFVDNTKRKPIKTGRRTSEEEIFNNKEVDEYLRLLGFKIFTAQGVKNEKRLVKRINTIVKRTLRRALLIANKLD